MGGIELRVEVRIALARRLSKVRWASKEARFLDGRKAMVWLLIKEKEDTWAFS